MLLGGVLGWWLLGWLLLCCTCFGSWGGALFNRVVFTAAVEAFPFLGIQSAVLVGAVSSETTAFIRVEPLAHLDLRLVVRSASLATSWLTSSCSSTFGVTFTPFGVWFAPLGVSFSSFGCC